MKLKTKYIFVYEGNSAIVYNRTKYGLLKIATFLKGVDALEYVKYKNDQD